MSQKRTRSLAMGVLQVLMILAALFAAAFLSSLVTQEFATYQANGQREVEFNSEYLMRAELPASLATDTIIVPMTVRNSDEAGVFESGYRYQGEQPLQWSFYGAWTTYRMHAIGNPGETIQVVLIQMSEADFREMHARLASVGYYDHPDIKGSVRVELGEHSTVVDSHSLKVTGA